MADQSYHKQAVNGVQAVVVGLGLTGVPAATPLPAGQVYERLLPSDLNVTLPAVLVTLVPKPPTQEGTLTGADDIGYAVGVTGLMAKNQDLTPLDAFMFWQQQVRLALNHKKPAALASALTPTLKEVKWEPGTPVDLELFRSANLWAWFDVYRVVTRETRGT